MCPHAYESCRGEAPRWCIMSTQKMPMTGAVMSHTTNNHMLLNTSPPELIMIMIISEYLFIVQGPLWNIKATTLCMMGEVSQWTGAFFTCVVHMCTPSPVMILPHKENRPNDFSSTEKPTKKTLVFELHSVRKVTKPHHCLPCLCKAEQKQNEAQKRWLKYTCISLRPRKVDLCS